MVSAEDLEARLWSRVDKRPDGCWIWTAARDSKGYGIIHRERRLWRAHRYFYVQARGPIPEGLVLDHLCSVRACVNPAHLEPVTMEENFARGPVSSNVLRRRAATHCLHGHPLEGDNLIMRTDCYARRCRICMNAAVRRYRRRKKEQALG